MPIRSITKSVSRLALLAGLNICLISLAAPAGAQVLFDNTKAETAGNADWIIDTSQPIPTPAITGITAGTAENYWTGALSSWGVALAKLANAGEISLPGNGLETLPGGGRITYGDASNAQDLSHYKVYVVCEPNILFTATEKTAILNFVKNGGGLFLVADHDASDRNNDGYDSLHIWNDLLTNNAVQNNPFGFSFNADDVSPTATVDGSAANPLTHGLAGTVTTLKYDQGCTMKLTDNTVAHAAVWQTNPSKVMALYGTFGAGRFCAIGDSSVVEDATSSQGTTYAGWTTPADNGYCVINGMVWLLAAVANTNQPPSATTSAASNLATNSATLNGSLNPNGQLTTAQFEYGLTTNYNNTVKLAGTFTGSNSVAVSTNLTGLAAATTYHFRLDATNAGGITYGLDQSFTTLTNTNVTNQPPGVTTSAASNVTTNSCTLNGSLNPNNQSTTAQFAYGLTTNYGNFILLAGTFTGGSSVAISTNLTGLVAGTTYHFRLDATNASGPAHGTDQSFTTSSTNSGGVTNYTGVLIGWDVSTVSNYGASPLPPTTNAPNLTVVGLTRGAGVATSGTAAGRAWGGANWSDADAATAVTSNRIASFVLAANSGYKLSCSSVSKFDYRRSSSGPTNGVLQFQIGNGAFTDITALPYGSGTAGNSGASLAAIDLSGIAALQNVGAGTNVTFRLANYGGGSGGTWYVYDTASSSALDFTVLGAILLAGEATNPPALAPTFAGLTYANGQFQLTLNGTAGSNYIVQFFNQAGSNWVSVQTNAAPFLFTEPNADAYETRFYRGLVAP